MGLWSRTRGCYTADIVSLQTRLAGVYEELGSANLDALPLSLLLSHPVLQEVISACTTYKAVVSYSSASSENYRLLKRWHERRRIPFTFSVHMSRQYKCLPFSVSKIPLVGEHLCKIVKVINWQCAALSLCNSWGATCTPTTFKSATSSLGRLFHWKLQKNGQFRPLSERNNDRLTAFDPGQPG